MIDIYSLLIDSLDTHIEIDSNVCHCSLTFYFNVIFNSTVYICIKRNAKNDPKIAFLTERVVECIILIESLNLSTDIHLICKFVNI